MTSEPQGREAGNPKDGLGIPALTAAAAALVSGVGALTLTGTLGGVQRNNGIEFALAIGLVVVGTGIWIAGAMIKTTARPLHIWGLTLGLREVVELFGVLVAPGTYDAIGVRAFTKKKPINCGAVPKGGKGSGNGTGCVIVTLPRHPDLPDLSASWGSSNPSASVLKLSASVADAAPGVAASRMAVLVWGVRHGKRSSLYRALMTVPPSGAVKRDLDLPIPSGMGRVCAEALMVDPAASLPSPACPLARQPGAAAVELRVPRP